MLATGAEALARGKKIATSGPGRLLRSGWAAAGVSWQDALANESGTKQHWAFVAPVRPALPAVRNDGWVRNPIDRFILARLEKEGLAPSREADRVTLAAGC